MSISDSTKEPVAASGGWFTARMLRIAAPAALVRVRASLTGILGFCDELLAIDDFADYGPNGLQVPGAEEVSRVATGVTANLELLKRAVGGGAELVLSGPPRPPLGGELLVLPPDGRPPAGPALRRGLLAAYHLPLDAHPRIGNNALLRERSRPGGGPARIRHGEGLRRSARSAGRPSR